MEPTTLQRISTRMMCYAMDQRDPQANRHTRPLLGETLLCRMDPIGDGAPPNCGLEARAAWSEV